MNIAKERFYFRHEDSIKTGVSTGSIIYTINISFNVTLYIGSGDPSFT
jgi:hypothetical protein